MICLISVPSKFSQPPPPLQRVSMLFIQVEMDQYRISDPVCVARMSIFCLYLYPYRRRLLQGLGVLIAKKRLHSKSVIADHLESEKRNKGFILFQTLPRGSQKLKIKCQIGNYQPKISLKIMTETNLLSKHLIAISIGCCSISNIDY